MHWLTDGHEKYLWHSRNGLEQLFNLDDDPQELVDLARGDGASQNGSLERWRKALASELKDREEGFVDADGNLLPGRPVRPILNFLKPKT